jgi:glycosyltransferase involved in cell wall biosynthesis
MHRVIVVTPAGRRRYVELLKHYVLADDGVDCWHLWDNCRNESDRNYIRELEKTSSKITVLRIPGSDGTNSSVNRYYGNCRDTDVFYIKMDDDIVFLPKNFSRQLYAKAVEEKERYAWWSPLVINNALCTWLLKYHGRVHIGNNITAQASCPFGWRSSSFAQALHELFLEEATWGNLAAFHVPNFEVSLSRFSINCIGFFGDFVSRFTQNEFCPPGVDDEEWISAVLPSRAGEPGRIIGDLVVSHYSYFTQERALLRSDVLSRYYKLAKLEMNSSYCQVPAENPKARLKRWLLSRLLSGSAKPDIKLLQKPTLELVRLQRSA